MQSRIVSRPTVAPLRAYTKGLLSSPDNELDDIAELGKAVYDAVVDALPDKVNKAMEPHLNGMEGRVAALVGHLVAKELDGRIAALEETYRHELAETVGQVKALMSQYEQMRAETAKAYAEGQEEVKTLLKSLPVPQVNVEVPAESITVAPSSVTIQAPNVNVTVPEEAIRLAPSVVHNTFSVPENAIHLDGIKIEHKMPKDAVKVLLEQPKARKQTTQKSILYGQDGRPEKIVEETSEE